MRFSSRLLAIALTPCLWPVGCGSNLDDPEGTPGQSISVSGGYVSSADGVFTVVFPPGALLETTLVTLTPVGDAPRSVATAYSINGPSALASEVYLQYRYTLPQIQGREAANLRLAGSAGDRWDTLPSALVDLDLQTVRASTPALNPAFGLIEALDTGMETETDTLESTGPTGDDSGTTDDETTMSGDSSDSGNDDTDDTDDSDDTAGDPNCDDGTTAPGELCWALGDPLVGKGMGPIALAVGELDDVAGDDIAVALQGGSAVAVWLADGAGTAGPEVLLPTTNSPLDVTIGDFNDDGTIDVAGVAGSDIALFAGDGAGGFDVEVLLMIAGGAITAASVDVNEDEISDFVVLRGNQTSVLLGQGMEFAEETTFMAGAGRVDIALADVTLDQNIDMITVGTEGITVLSGNGSGLFGKAQPTAVGGTLVALAAGRFNGDLALDVAVLDEAGERIVVFLGNGLGGFGGAIPYAVASEPAALQAADVDGDDLTDLVVLTTSDDSVTVLHGQGNGSFDAGTPWVVGTRPFDLALGDINADGSLDAVVIQEDGSIGLLLSAP